MKRTKDEMSEMTNKKMYSDKTVDRLVMDELLEMGFSYNQIGTHYLHDSIVYSTTIRLEDFGTVKEFCKEIKNEISKKYRTSDKSYCEDCGRAIEKAFLIGNICYIMDVFKNSCERDKMTVSKNAFIMTVRRKIMDAIEKQNSYNIAQLRIIIQGELENIMDMPILESMYNIVVSLKGSVNA